MIKVLLMRHSLTRRLLLGFLLISVLPLVGLAVVNIDNFKTTLTRTVLANLAAIADKKIDQIDSYINDSRINTRLLGASPDLLKVFTQLQTAYAQGIDSKAYREAMLQAEVLLEKMSSGINYYDLLLINTEGVVIFSQKKEADFTTNIRTGPYKNTVLNAAFRRAMAYLSTEFSTFGLYAPSDNKPAAFAVTPLLANGIPIGVLAIQINLEMYQPVVSDHTGLGESGETVLAQQTKDKAIFTTLLRYVGNQSFDHQVSMGKLAVPMQYALNGERGEGINTDYAGREVVAAWRYLPSLHWGMVVKMDANEALAPLLRLRSYSILILSLLILIAAMFALMIGRSIIAPVRQLITSADEIALGHLNQRISVTRRDEFGQLATAFNHMADEVQHGHEELEQRVVRRTTELSIAKNHAEEALIQLEQTQESLVQTEKLAALGGLVAGIAHEINTPVGITLSSATFLEAETEKVAALYSLGELGADELESYFDIARQSSKLMTLNSRRAADLIHSFKKIAVDQSSDEHREFELKLYLEEVLLSLRPALKKTALTVKLECPEKLLVQGYPGAVSQMLTNFVMNSLHHGFNPGQKGLLSISVTLLSDDRVELIYRDDGKGIPVNVQTKIFDPFFTTQRGHGGSGLGLHIVYNIVHSTLKGSLEMISDAGQGTAFIVRFPRVLIAA